jgi:hypothetical protein
METAAHGRLRAAMLTPTDRIFVANCRDLLLANRAVPLVRRVSRFYSSEAFQQSAIGHGSGNRCR